MNVPTYHTNGCLSNVNRHLRIWIGYIDYPEMGRFISGDFPVVCSVLMVKRAALQQIAGFTNKISLDHGTDPH